MNKEEKQLLFRVLCEMLPYNCIVTIAEGGIDGLQWNNVTLNLYLLYQIEDENGWEYVKPYLRPLSSMTEVEKQIYETMSRGYTTIQIGNFVNWINAHHFDYCGLIEKGLAIEAPEGMYN